MRNFSMMMVGGDVVQYKELLKFGLADYLVKADQFSLEVETKLRNARKR